MSDECFGVGYAEYHNNENWSTIIHSWLDALPKLPRGRKELVAIKQCFFFERKPGHVIYRERKLIESILRERDDVQLIDFWENEKMLDDVEMYAQYMGRWSP